MSKIEWTDETWNPIAGCSLVSPGCTNCYAMNMAFRLERMLPKLNHYEGLTQSLKAGPLWTGKVSLAPERTLLEPLRRKKPTTYFVNSMSDLFHEDVPDWWIYLVLAAMALTYDGSKFDENRVIIERKLRHRYQVLTKRSARMKQFMAALHAAADLTANPDWLAHRFSEASRRVSQAAGHPFWMNAPLSTWQWVADGCPGLWLGVSAERQQEADVRIPDLLATPAAVRFVSAEPLLAPIDFKGWLTAAWEGDRRMMKPAASLSWVIVGGESGPGARPMHPDWARSIRDQCQAAGVAFFFKQWGNWIDHGPAWGTAAVDEHPVGRDWLYVDADGTSHRKRESAARCARAMERVGKKEAGRLLDGRQWNEMPAPAKEVAA